MVCLTTALRAEGQSNLSERKFQQAKAVVEKALQSLQNRMSGRLPILDGFARQGEHPLERYQRGYYQATAEVLPAPGGGSVVRIRAKVTAWYSDTAASHSGYQLLDSNGRLESDLLDELQEQLAATASANDKSAAEAPSRAPEVTKLQQPSAPEPERRFPLANGSLSAALKANAADQAPAGKAENRLQSEADNLERILKNTAHPNNLVAVKKSGTPVVAEPTLSAKPQFMASMHDEFELLDFNTDWVHVRISGLSRGWIWRNSVEMPEGIADTQASVAPALAPAADLFHVVREETAPFPGDWEPLRGKSVKIISVQKTDDPAHNVGSTERLAYAKFLLEKTYTEIAEKKLELQGIVVVFDSADGGMIGATVTALQQWRAGTLTDSALWHKCFFDPPETFDSTGSSGGN